MTPPEPPRRHLAVRALAWTRSLRFQLTAWYTLVLGLVLASTAIVVFLEAQRLILRQTDDYLTLEAHGIVSSTSSNDPDEVSDLRQGLGSVASVTLKSQTLPGVLLFEAVYGRVIDPSTGNVIAVTRHLKRHPDVIATMADVVRARLTRHSSAAAVLAATSASSDQGEWMKAASEQFAGADQEGMMRILTQPILVHHRLMLLQLAVSWKDNEEAIARFGVLLCVTIPLVLLISALGSWVVIGRTLRPIGRIVAEVERADIRSLSGALLPSPAETDSEVGRLVATLNGMAARMHHAFDAQRRFAADASHELRTPLTFLRGEIEYTLLRPRDAETYKAALENAVTAIERLTRTVESLSYLARLDSGESPAPHRPSIVDINVLLSGVVDEHRADAAARSIDLTFQPAGAAICVHGEEAQLRLMLRNLLDNALKYTPAGGVVNATIADDNIGNVEIAVADTGPGISSEEIDHIFDRFWRTDRARTQAPDGSGLGLSIARQIAQVHGGSVGVVSELGRGSTFTICLPSAR